MAKINYEGEKYLYNLGGPEVLQTVALLAEEL